MFSNSHTTASSRNVETMIDITGSFPVFFSIYTEKIDSGLPFFDQYIAYLVAYSIATKMSTAQRSLFLTTALIDRLNREGYSGPCFTAATDRFFNVDTSLPMSQSDLYVSWLREAAIKDYLGIRA